MPAWLQYSSNCIQETQQQVRQTETCLRSKISLVKGYPSISSPLQAQCSLLNWCNLSDLSAAHCLLQERIYLIITILVCWCQCQCGGTVRNGHLRETRTDICPKLYCLYSTDYALLHSQLASTSLNVWLLLVFIRLLWDQLCPGTAQWIQTSCGEFCYEAHVCEKQLLCLVVQNESNGKRPQRSERVKDG